MKLKLKDHTVNLDGIHMEMIVAILAAMRVCMRHGVRELVITSARDGRHGKASLHGSGEAIDLRNFTWPDTIGMADEIREELDQDYDVVLEHDHLHIEYDPKP